VKAEGFNPARHAIVCNGRRVPLAATGLSGEFVAGVQQSQEAAEGLTRVAGELRELASQYKL